MTKVVYNDCYGGFRLSSEAIQLGKELSGDSEWGNDMYDIERHDPILVRIVESLGERANSQYADLKIQDIPSGTKYRIDEYDGNESVMTIDDYKWAVTP